MVVEVVLHVRVRAPVSIFLSDGVRFMCARDGKNERNTYLLW